MFYQYLHKKLTNGTVWNKTKFGHTDRTVLIHMNSAWVYMTTGKMYKKEENSIFPSMKLIETSDEIKVPDQFYVDYTCPLERTAYSDYEYVLYVWNKVFRKYITLEDRNGSNRVSQAYEEFTKDENVEEEEVSLTCHETIDLNYSRHVLDVLIHNKEFMNNYEEDQYDNYMKQQYIATRDMNVLMAEIQREQNFEEEEKEEF